jgi:ArsR family transcriptional regulator, arsenate/arsenite/antimonite-responsive transcriptional repressor
LTFVDVFILHKTSMIVNVLFAKFRKSWKCREPSTAEKYRARSQTYRWRGFAMKMHVPTKASTTPATCCAPLAADTLTESDAVALALAFAALADPVRLRLLNLIATAPTGEACACDLVDPVGKSQPTVSHHLKILVDAQLVTREKRGVWAWYRARPDKLTELRAFLS